MPLQDFESNNELKTKVIAFLEEVMHDPELLTQERKAAANIIRYRRCKVLLGVGRTICANSLTSRFLSGLSLRRITVTIRSALKT